MNARILNQAKFCWHRVNRSDVNECWLWNGSLNRWGYGACQYNGKVMNASRAAYIEANGPVAEGMVVCHRCDNPRCCNPSHLFLGTPADNLADCRAKGRQRYLYGADHHRSTAKLSAEKVREARRLYASGIPQTVIGRRFGVDSSTISRAVRGDKWKHVA